jgi:hypothetical protein
MTIEKAKTLDIVEYLSRLGYEPQKISGINYWYLSPLRTEKTPSFKINRKLNRWFDFAEGKGGNLVDFGTLLHNCSISEFLQRLENGSLPVPKPSARIIDNEESNQITILSTFAIISYPLIKYLQERRVPIEIAERYLQEVRYQIGDKTYYALGFKNNAGGYELRNQNFKGSSSPKDITYIDNKAKKLVVFEGFFNFLSYCSMFSKQQISEHNFLILNSTSFFERSLPKMQEHRHVHLLLDNDKTGTKYTQLALSLDKEKFSDERRLYQGYDDLNDWLMNIGTSHKQHFRQKH